MPRAAPVPLRSPNVPETHGAPMNTSLLQSKFEALGARVRFGPAGPRVDRVSVDIRRDRKGEYFHLELREDRPLRVEVLDCRPRDRHLLLMVAAAPDAGRPTR